MAWGIHLECHRDERKSAAPENGAEIGFFSCRSQAATAPPLVPSSSSASTTVPSKQASQSGHQRRADGDRRIEMLPKLRQRSLLVARFTASLKSIIIILARPLLSDCRQTWNEKKSSHVLAASEYCVVKIVIYTQSLRNQNFYSALARLSNS